MGFLKELARVFGLADDVSQDVRGWQVLDESGVGVGRVDDLVYDERSHEIRYVVVNLGTRHVTIPVGDLRYDNDQREVTATGYTLQRLEALSSYLPGEWSEAKERAHYMDHFPEAKAVDYGHERFRPNPYPDRIATVESRLRDQAPERPYAGAVPPSASIPHKPAERPLTFAGTEPTEADLQIQKRALDGEDL